MQGCLIIFLALMLLGAAPEFFFAVMFGALLVVAAVYGIHGAGSLTALLVVPRSPDRWTRLIDDCRDMQQLDLVRIRLDRWTANAPGSVMQGAVKGLLGGFAWGGVVLAAVWTLAWSTELWVPPPAAWLGVALSYAAMAGRAGILNALWRLDPDRRGLSAVARLIGEWQGCPSETSAGAEPRLPDVLQGRGKPALTPAPLLSPQPRVARGSSLVLPASTPIYDHLHTQGVSRGAPQAVPFAAQVPTCAACGRLVSSLARCGCS